MQHALILQVRLTSHLKLGASVPVSDAEHLQFSITKLILI